jgi:hypothetical protein
LPPPANLQRKVKTVLLPVAEVPTRGIPLMLLGGSSTMYSPSFRRLDPTYAYLLKHNTVIGSAS